MIVEPGSAPGRDKAVHATFALLQRFERRFEPFFRPGLNAALRESTVKLIQKRINSQRKNDGLALAEERTLPGETKPSIG